MGFVPDVTMPQAAAPLVAKAVGASVIVVKKGVDVEFRV